MSKRNVEVIPAKPRFIHQGLTEQPKLKVAAYCRVSTSEDEQLSSFEAQREHYFSHIKNNLDWEYAGIYADEGISGTSTKKRDQFNSMIEDCLGGKIDMILTKSVSRFARNTLDCLRFIRLLKENNIAVYFEKENINTLDAKGEVLLVIISSLAQEESFSLSHNTRWGIVHRFQSGKVVVNAKRFLGYDKDENGELVIVPEQAEIVRRIYREFLEGKSTRQVAKVLTLDGLKNGAGNTKWYESNIITILKNEKYMGDSRLQKTYTVDFLTKKRVKNNGIVQSYYVTDSHEPIVSSDDFASVQAEFKRRSSIRGYSTTGKNQYGCKYPFSGMLFCYNCGAKLQRSCWSSGKNKSYIWKCTNKSMNGLDACSAKDIKEKDLEKAFVRAVRRAIDDEKAFLEQLLENISMGIKQVEQEFTMEELNERLEELGQEMMGLVRLNARAGKETSAYEAEYLRVSEEMEQIRERKALIEEAELSEIIRQKRIQEMKKFLNSTDTPLAKFDAALFRRLVEKVVIQSLVEAAFVFKCGIELREILSS